MILSLVEADLQNSFPDTGKSKIFGLMLPYAVDASGRRTFSTQLPSPPSTTIDVSNSIGLDDAENPVALTAFPRPLYQVSVFYQAAPAATDLTSLQARIVVNWPPLPSGDIADLTKPGKVSGFVESLVSFPAP